MDQQSYAAAQQGLLECYLDPDQHQHLQVFLGALRNDPRWTDEQIRSIETVIQEVLGAPGRHEQPLVAALSEREEVVLKMLATGYKNREIAIKLEISPKTVETYKGRALTKLGLVTRVDIVRYARERGWI